MIQQDFIKRFWSEQWIPSLVLICALGLGLLYVFLVPPWQHYDEPGHFEYTWLIANNSNLPQDEDFDQSMRRELAASMIEHDFFRGMDFTSTLLSFDAPVWIGDSQTYDPPLYYWLVALPLRLVQTSDITFQLYLGRMVSLILYLVTITAAYGVIAELTSHESPLRWILPLSIALLPSFVDLMTAINNDVLATAFFSLFLWFAVVLLKRGYSLPRIIGLIVSALLCWWVKNTVMIAIFLVPIVLVMSLPRGRWYGPVNGFLVLALLVGLLYAIKGGDAAFWYRNQTQESPVRTITANGPFGKFALQQTLISGESPVQIFQIIPGHLTNGLGGRTVSLGAWIWADQPMQVLFPQLDYGVQTPPVIREIGVRPKFHAITVTLPSDISHMRVVLSPTNEAARVDNTIYYSGLVMAEGERPADKPPQFDDSSGNWGNWGNWGDQPFQNLIRNFTAEAGWVRLRTPVERALSNIFPAQSSLILPSFFDLSGSWVYYRPTIEQLFRTFWAKFGWGHVTLLGSRPYRVLAAISLAGLAGSLLFVLRSWQRLPWNVLMVMGLATAAIWGATLIRGINFIFGGTFLPVARYAYPAIIPSMAVLTLGLLELLYILGRWFHIPPRWQLGIYTLFFISLDLLSVVSIYTYYHDCLSC